MSRDRRKAQVPRHMLDAVQAAGIDIGRLAASAGLTAEQLDAGLTADEMDRFSTAIWAALPDPSYGLAAGSWVRSHRFGVVGFAAMTSPSFGIALVRNVRYARLTWGDVHELREEAHETTVALCPPASDRPYQQMKLDFQLSTLLALGREFVDPELRPLRITVRGPAPSYARRYGEIFGCPVHFDSEHHSITFSRRDTERPMLSANPQLSPVFEQHAEGLLSQLADTDTAASTASQVRLALRDMLQGEEPTLASVASALRLSTRTLQRRLAQDKLNFRDLLDGARRELAEQYLRSSTGSLMEISYMLGFSDPNSFFRAFKRWTGTTPEGFRSAQLAAASSREP